MPSVNYFNEKYLVNGEGLERERERDGLILATLLRIVSIVALKLPWESFAKRTN